MSENFSIEQIIMFGFDYNNCPLDMREQVSFVCSDIKKGYKKIHSDNQLKEAVILSTCNRSEIYAIALNKHQGEEYLKNFYSEFFNIDLSKFKNYIIVKSGHEAIKHVFEVSCGFKSLVLGEDQVLGQVKKAYKEALNSKASGKFLNRLFIDSITLAKKVKQLTGISQNPVSVASIGIAMLEQNLCSLINKTVLVVGLGKMSRIAIQNMISKGIDKIYVTNRTQQKVIDFANEFPNICEVDFQDRYSVIADVDIIISCTAAPHYVINYEMFKQYYKNKPLYILDLSVPRDIDPSISKYSDVQIYKVDDLEKIAEENAQKRLIAKDKGEKILLHSIKKYLYWLEETKLIDIITSMQDHAQELLSSELDDLKKKLSDTDEKQMQIIEKSFCSFAKSFIHQPMIQLKEFVKENPRFADFAITRMKEDV